jgi:hypothetical protein
MDESIFRILDLFLLPYLKQPFSHGRGMLQAYMSVFFAVTFLSHGNANEYLDPSFLGVVTQLRQFPGDPATRSGLTKRQR